MIRAAANFVTLTLLAWAAAAIPLRWLGSDWRPGFAALVLCLVPATLTFLWGRWAFRQSPEQQMLMVLGGAGLRMVVVLGAGLVLYYAVPALRSDAFWLWLAGCYLLTLATEVGMLLAGKNQDGTMQQRA